MFTNFASDILTPVAVRHAARPAARPLPRTPGERLIRISDVVIATTAVILLAPLMIAIALTIVATSGGPVLFLQRRLGRGGRQFTCLKFRTMYVGADRLLEQLLHRCARSREEWERDQKLSRDPRVLAVGRFLRRTSLDELPQLLNVLAGTMSIVGPRPIIAGEADRYGRYLGSYCAVPPGITGLWQVSGRNSTTYRRRVACDIVYARRRSARYNFAIMLATVPVVLTGKGAY